MSLGEFINGFFNSNDFMDYTDNPIVEKRFGDVTVDTSLEAGLPQTTPYWIDLIDTEKVSADGEGVYVAVLDTGLVPAWPFLFSEAVC